MKKWIPTLAFIVTGLVAQFQGPIQAFLSAHPSASAALAAIAGIVAHILPSPASQK